MCSCGKPTINGEPDAHSWDGKTWGTYPVVPPTLAEGDTLVYDEPGRCGGIDSHSYHFRVVKAYCRWYLLVRHGGGEERIHLYAYGTGLGLESVDPGSRYWLLCSLYHTVASHTRQGLEEQRTRWARAAIEKRIKVRRRAGRTTVEVVDPSMIRA